MLVFTPRILIRQLNNSYRTIGQCRINNILNHHMLLENEVI